MPRETVVPLPVPVPPMLEQALAYPGQAGLVAFFWSPSGDEAVYADGLRSGVGDWAAYLAFVQHPLVEPHLLPYDLGSSEAEVQHWLLLDREARALSALPVEEAVALLQQQWGIQQARLPLQWETLDPIPELLATLTGKRGWRAISIEMVPVPQPGPEQGSRLAELLAWLDQQKTITDPPPVTSCFVAGCPARRKR
jgi:hypothetical protein